MCMYICICCSSQAETALVLHAAEWYYIYRYIDVSIAR